MITAKYPLEKCLILNYDNLNILEKEFGKSFRKLKNRKSTHGERHDGMYEFIDEKVKKLTFPSFACYQSAHLAQIKRYGKKNAGPAMFHIENGCVIQLPISYDATHDLAEAVEKKMNFLNMMKEMLGKKFKEEDFEKHVDHGSTDFSWINELLSFLHNKFPEYYIDGKISIFIDYKDEENWSGSKELVDHPYPKAFYLSEIETLLQDLGIKTSDLYETILDNMYIEGRYWERFFYWELTEENFRKKKVSLNYRKALTAVKQILKDHIVSHERYDDDALLLPIYIDYYKDIKIR